MQQWAVDEKDEFIDEGPKIGQYDVPTTLDLPGSNKKDKKDKSLSKKQSSMNMNQISSQAKLKSKEEAD